MFSPDANPVGDSESKMLIEPEATDTSYYATKSNLLLG